MKIATLGLVIRDGKLLLGEKKKGEIGTGVLSGPGGKLDPGESLTQCLVRETREELGIELDGNALEEVAIIDFYAAGQLDFRVHVFRTDLFTGELTETEDMVPGWYSLDALPFDRMYEGDRHWMARAVRGEKFMADVFYSERAKKFDRIEFTSRS